jgi:hypothetical protein
VRSAVSEHCRQLAELANRLAGIIDAETRERPLPTRTLCHVAIAVDRVTKELALHCEALTDAQSEMATVATSRNVSLVKHRPAGRWLIR